MFRSSSFLTTVLAAAVIVSPQVSAKDREAPASRYDPATLLLANVQDGTSRDAYLANLLEAFRAVDTDQNGLDRDDIARIDIRMREDGEEQRRRRVEQFRREIERMDANDDGGVTEAEVLAVFEYERSGRAEVDRKIDGQDLNRDGFLDANEIGAQSGRQAEQFAGMDTDGDQRLSKDELLAAIPKQPSTSEVPNLEFSRLDTDGNGIVTAEEMAEPYVPRELDPKKTQQRRALFERLLRLGSDGNEVLSEAELTSAFLSQFGRVDTDSDGKVSRQEYRSSRRLVTIAREIIEAPFCAVPPPHAGTDLVAVLAQGGQLVSTVAIGGTDRETSIVDVKVEPGDDPLYVLLIARDPVIWDFTGALERVSEVVVFSGDVDEAGNHLVGLIGLPDAKISYGEPGCIQFRKLGGIGPSNIVRLENQIGAITGLPFKLAAGKPGTVFLPSLSVEMTRGPVPAPEGFDPDIWWMAIADRPRGIGDPDPDAIVSRASVERYDVLPREFGLSQLAYRGVVEPTEHLNEFRILKPLDQFPGGLQQSGWFSFVLGEGVPRPAGESGRGCIYGSDGATVIEGDHCMQHPRGNAMQIRYDTSGKACLFRYGGENAGCFPDDGGPLRAIETEEGRKFEPVPTDEQVPETMSIPQASDYRSPIEIIPAGLRQRW